MSASIYYRPTSDRKYLKSARSPSLFIEAMKTMFGEPPWKLTGNDIGKLQGMAAVHEHSIGSGPSNPYADLAEKVDTHDEIEVWPEW